MGSRERIRRRQCWAVKSRRFQRGRGEAEAAQTWGGELSRPVTSGSKTFESTDPESGRKRSPMQRVNAGDC